MKNLRNMIWVEWRKAVRSRIPLWTSIGSLFLPMAIGLLILISRNPEISRKLGVVSAKADLIAFSATDWPAYMILIGQIFAAAGFFLFVVILTWVFGREFSDGTVKDLLAVPVPRSTILLAKFFVYAVWAAAMSMLILVTSLVMGMLVQIPGISAGVIGQGCLMVILTAGMTALVVIPFALLASAGRGYLLPMSLAVFTLILANVAAALGWGDVFPWSIPGLFSQNTGSVGPAGYWIVVITGLIGWLGTDMWWKKADQNR